MARQLLAESASDEETLAPAGTGQSRPRLEPARLTPNRAGHPRDLRTVSVLANSDAAVPARPRAGSRSPLRATPEVSSRPPGRMVHRPVLPCATLMTARYLRPFTLYNNEPFVLLPVLFGSCVNGASRQPIVPVDGLQEERNA
jgi:hypothetical protein